jgi:4-oxalocrotonate tautomerase family enzyme
VKNLPVVQLSVWTGISLENKKKIVQGITTILEEIGIPQDAITVIIYEAPKENWASEDNCTLKGSMSSLAPDRNSSSFEIAFC